MNILLFILINLYLIYSWKTFSKEYFLKKVQVFNLFFLIFCLFFLYQINFSLYLIIITFSSLYFYTDEVKEKHIKYLGIPFLFFINHAFFIFSSLFLFLSFFNFPVILELLYFCLPVNEEVSLMTKPGLEVVLKKSNEQKSYLEKNKQIKVYIQEEVKQKVNKHFSETPLILQQKDLKEHTNAILYYVTFLTENSLQNQHISPMEGAKDAYEKSLRIKFPLESEKLVMPFKGFTEDVNNLTLPYKNSKISLPWYVMPTVNSIALMESKPLSQVYAASVFYSQECLFNQLSAEETLKFYLDIPDKGTSDPSNLVAIDKKGRMMGSHFSEIYYEKWKASKGEVVTKATEKNKDGRLPDFIDQNGRVIEVKLLNIHNDHNLLPSVIEFEEGKGKGSVKLFKNIAEKSAPFKKALHCSKPDPNSDIEKIIALDCCILVDLFKFYGYTEEETLALFSKSLKEHLDRDDFEVFCTK